MPFAKAPSERSEVSWKKLLQKVRSEKDLRHVVRRYLRAHLRGLSSGFRIEVEALDLRPKRVAIKIPAHSEGNLIRVAQVDRLVAELEAMGLEVEVLYQDDLAEEGQL